MDEAFRGEAAAKEAPAKEINKKAGKALGGKTPRRSRNWLVLSVDSPHEPYYGSHIQHRRCIPPF